VRHRRLFALGAVVLLLAGAAYLAGAGATGTPGELAIGQAAPDFVAAGGTQGSLVDLDGDPIHLADFAGRPLWIVFWATWCTPCQQEAPDIQAAYLAHADDGLAVLAIDVQEPGAAVRRYVAEHGLEYAIGLDAGAAIRARYGGWGLPIHYFVDAQGRIRDRYFGQLSAALMEEHLRTILGS
jgi:peroxiredoxin